MKMKKIILLTIILSALLSGCATHREVAVKCAMAVQLARCEALADQASINQPVCDKINELDRRLCALDGRMPGASDSITADDAIDLIEMELSVHPAEKCKGSNIRLQMEWVNEQRRIFDCIRHYRHSTPAADAAYEKMK